MKRLIILIGAAVALFMGCVVLARIGDGLNSPVVITREDEQKVILRLGRVVMVTGPGLWYRIPFVDKVTSDHDSVGARIERQNMRHCRFEMLGGARHLADRAVGQRDMGIGELSDQHAR